MENPIRLLVVVALTVALSACASAPPKTPEVRPPGTGRLEVTTTGFKSEEGMARIALFLGCCNLHPVSL